MNSKKVSFVLFVLMFILLISIVLMTYQSRKSFIEWKQMEDLAYEMEVEYGQLLLEKSTLASLTHVEETAKEKLDMVRPKGKQFQVFSMR